MYNFFLKKVEIWLVGLLIVCFIFFTIISAAILRDAYLEKNKTPKVLRETLVYVSEIPKNTLKIIDHFMGSDINLPPTLDKHKDKKRFERFINKKRNALLVLPRYDHSESRAMVDIIDLNNFELIHRYKHDIENFNNQVENLDEFPSLNIDTGPVRFHYTHPLILEDGSLIGKDSGPLFKLDLCSNLQWINDQEVFHHSLMLDSKSDIWASARQNPYSKFVDKFDIEDFRDDSIVKLNKDGDILYNKSVIEILIENKIFPENFPFSSIKSGQFDPLHLNDIEPALSDTKYWKKDDLFLSIRNQSAIIHYRPSTNKIINYITGPFAEQHDVDIISDKEISIFNNNHFFKNNKYSEVIIYNFETQKFTKLFNKQLQEENIKTQSGGLHDILKDGALMVEEQNHGRIILFNKKGEKEWEFINKDSNQDIGLVSWSRIIEDKLFIAKFKQLAENKEC
jgi:hypothetical protein